MSGLSKPVWAALILTLGLTVWMAVQQPESGPVVEAQERGARKKPAPQAASISPAATPALLAPAARIKAREDIFAARDWTPPPPPPPPEPPPTPQAPPLEASFRIIGRLAEIDGVTVFFEYQGAPMAMSSGPKREGILAPGDTIAGQYRIETVTPQVLTLTYLPLNQAQTLHIGG